MANVVRKHTFHAEATVLHGDLYHPLVQEIKPQSNVKLAETGGYLSEHAEPYRLEGVIAFDKAYTQAAGNDNDRKPEGGWNTLVTSVIEGLNILEVVTADRVIGQIATHHSKDGYIPRIHFLGTRFENLRIAGHPIKVNLHPGHPYHLTLPENDAPYTQHPDFLGRVKSLFQSISNSTGAPDGLLERYSPEPAKANGEESIEGSLVTDVENMPFGGSFGNVLYIPDFGKIHLATVKITHSDYGPAWYDPQKYVYKKTLVELKMVDLDLGCSASGTGTAGTSVTNGQSYP